jgi:predicted dehydrogenase
MTIRKSEKARIAVIGTGWWSTYTHIPGLQAYPDANLVALCDSNAQKLQAAEEKYQVGRTYTDYHEMLKNEALDGVVIATSHASHYEIARYCLEHDLHVMIEKPMVLYARHAQALVDLAGDHQRELMIGYPYHYTPAALRAREVIQSGELGAVQYVNCVFASHIRDLLSGRDGSEKNPGGYPVHGPGNVYSQPHLSGGGEGHLQVTHSAGLMFFTTGLRAKRVHALMVNHGLPLDLVDAMTVEFEGAALGTVGGCGNTGRTGGGKLDLSIYCEDGCVVMDALNGKTVIYRENQAAERFDPPEGNPEAIYPRFAPSHNLAEVILGRAANGSPGEIGWRTVELLDAAYRSAQVSGQAVMIDDLYAIQEDGA